MMKERPIIAWWSGGVTSAVACRIALERYPNVRLCYIHINSHHPDTIRFKADCEKWYGQPIEQFQSEKYKDQFEVIEKTKYVNGPGGARCTGELKKEVRYLIEQKEFSNQVHGYEFLKKEINRAIRFAEQYPYTNPIYPLIEKRITKEQSAGIIQKAGISLPEMYLHGFINNNCIGCVKGGKYYWNQIRVEFPEVFAKMMNAEIVAKHSCIKGTFLHALKPNAGRRAKEIIPNCGTFCDVEFAEVISPKVARIMSGELSIKDAIAA